MNALLLPLQVDWASMNLDMMLECSGVFLTRKALQPFFDGGIKKVVVSAPVKDADPVLNIVYGVNHVRQNHSVTSIM